MSTLLIIGVGVFSFCCGAVCMGTYALSILRMAVDTLHDLSSKIQSVKIEGKP